MLLPGGVSQVTVICDATKKTPGPNEKAIKIISNDAVKPTFEIKVGADIVEKITKKRLHSVPRVYEEEDLVPYVTSSQLISFMSEGKTIEILDVRERSEYSLKHIHNAINFPRSELVYGQGDMLNVLKTLNKKATIAVHCGGGIRSSYIARRLREYGFDAYNLEGGLKAWENMGYPLVEGPKLPPSKEPLFISLEEAYDHYFVMFKEKTIWIDVRDSNEYNKGHIKNAINIPLDTLKQNISVIPTDKEIVLYCDGRDCDAAIAAGRLLVADGSFKQPKIKVLLEGFDGWKQAKYSIEE